jgi:thiol-disulfide isomerase/thioredoxin
MSHGVKESREGKLLLRGINLLIAGSPGAIAPEIIAKEINGKEIRLSQYAGKYVLLDFWASWCVPCRKYNPQLTQLYNKYREKGIEFIGISDDDRSQDAWKKAVEKDQLQWPQVLRGLDAKKKRNNERNPNDINENYGIQLLPTKILIDPQGRIIARFNDEQPGLEEMLHSIFDKSK